MKIICTLAALTAFAGMNVPAIAAPPTVPTLPPYIVLSDNQDEPNGNGFCIDTMARGQTDLIQTHSCKPALDDTAPQDAPDHDVRFAYNPETKQIQSFAYENMCVQVLMASTRNVVFALLTCSDAPRQRFTYGNADKTLRLEENEELCVAAVPETTQAGPWVSRKLMLANCEETETALKQWTVVSN